MIAVKARLVCGCCDADMQFKSLKSARAAFEKVGYGHFDMVDDASVTHKGIDTFYGFWQEEEKRPGLAELAEKAGILGKKEGSK